MRFENPYWSDKLKVNMLQRWILIHSILYYEMDSPVVSDIMFDNNSKQLVALMKLLPVETLKKSKYWYCMKDFDGSTGFDLYSELNDEDKNWLFRIAERVKMYEPQTVI